MIQEDYVSFETAKLLKEKRFDEGVLFTINREGFQQYPTNLEFEYLHNSEVSVDEYACPTLQMAMKWLREVHNIAIGITFRKPHRILWEIYKNEEFISGGDSPLSYEDVCDNAIKYALNLI